jgi:hypothetical protein
VPASEGAVTEHRGKNRDLWTYLVGSRADDLRMSFRDIERILRFPPPPSSRKHLAHWYSYEGSAVVRAIRDAGYHAVDVDLQGEAGTFRRG